MSEGESYRELSRTQAASRAKDLAERFLASEGESKGWQWRVLDTLPADDRAVRKAARTWSQSSMGTATTSKSLTGRRLWMSDLEHRPFGFSG